MKQKNHHKKKLGIPESFYSGMFAFLSFGILFPLTNYGQLVQISEGVRMVVTQTKSIDGGHSQACILFNGNVVNRGVLENNGEIRFSGNFLNQGVYKSTGDDLFCSGNLQALSGTFTGKSYFHNLIAKKAGAVLLFQCDADVRQAIHIEEAILLSNTHSLYLQNTDSDALKCNASSGRFMNYIDGQYKQNVKPNSQYRLMNGDSLHGAQLVEVKTGLLSDGSILCCRYSGSSARYPADIEGCKVKFNKQSGTWYLGVMGNGNLPALLRYNFLPAGLNAIQSSPDGIEALKNEENFVSNPCVSLGGNYQIQTSGTMAAYSIVSGLRSLTDSQSIREFDPSHSRVNKFPKGLLIKVYPALFAQVLLRPILWRYGKKFK